MRTDELLPDSDPPDSERATSPTDRTGLAKQSGPVLGVTVYERVTSLLLTWILILGVFTLGFGAVWAAKWTWGLNPKPPPQVQLLPPLDVGGGGEEDGEPDVDQFAIGPDGQNISMPASPDSVVLSWVTSAGITMMTVVDAMGPAVENSESLMAGPVLGESALPTGNPGSRRTRPRLGGGPGREGGVKRSQRWEIVFDQGQTEQEYARQLDFFGVELGAVVDGKLCLASKLAADKPTVRELTHTAQEKRLYFSWRGGSRRQVDISLLAKAGVPIEHGNVIVIQFCPDQTEQLLARLERDAAERSGKASKDGKLWLESVRKTKFVVVKDGAGYKFEIARIDFFPNAPTK